MGILLQFHGTPFILMGCQRLKGNMRYTYMLGYVIVS